MIEKTFGLNHKIKKLNTGLKEMGRFAVAFSGGADSTFLLAAAKQTGPEKLLAVTVVSQFVPHREIVAAETLARESGVDHIVLYIDILSHADVVGNTEQRCYYCKKEMFLTIFKMIRSQGIDVLLHAVNLDDMDDFRPGLKAAQQLGVLSPLVDAGFTKADVRLASRQFGLETWNKPSQSCLATRIPYNKGITNETLQRVDRAEVFLQDLGFAQVRVRCHETLARIEVMSDQLEKLVQKKMRDKVSKAFVQFGFEFVSIDIDGYKTGKLNHEILTGQSR